MKGLLEALSREALRTGPSPVPWYRTENECSRLYKEISEKLNCRDGSRFSEKNGLNF